MAPRYTLTIKLNSQVVYTEDRTGSELSCCQACNSLLKHYGEGAVGVLARNDHRIHGWAYQNGRSWPRNPHAL